MSSEKTNRGFGIYGRAPSRGGGAVRVQQSSLAFEGAHVWLFLDGEKCVEHMGQHHKPDPHLSVASAKILVAALQEFIREAEAGELIEPAAPTPESP